jgi:hypothetical protein
MTEQIHCAGLTTTGQPCRRQKTPGKDHCWWHDPDRASERETGVRTLPEPPQPLLEGPMPLETPEEIHALLTQLANRLATDPTSDTARAYSLATVAGVLLRAARLRDLHQEIAHLRAQNEELNATARETERQLTYARQDVERYRRSLTELRDQHRPGPT